VKFLKFGILFILFSLPSQIILGKETFNIAYQANIYELVVSIDPIVIETEEDKIKFRNILLDELFRNKIWVNSSNVFIDSSNRINIVRRFRTKKINSLINSTDSPKDIPGFIVEISLSRARNNFYYIDFQWIDLEDSTISRIYKLPIQASRDTRLSKFGEQISKSLLLNLLKKVRLSISPFLPVWQDSSFTDMNDNIRYLRELNHTLRYLLGTSLAQTPWIGIADIPEDLELTQSFIESQRRQQRQKERFAHIYRAETAIEPGQLVFPNYILYGNLMTATGYKELRLDCWIVSIESQLVVAADGITIKDSTLNSLSKSVQGLANRLSRLIELKAVLSRPPREVMGVIPSRNMEIPPHYAGRTFTVIETIDSKLKEILVNDIILYNDYSALKRYFLKENDPEKIDYDELVFHYNVDNLLKVNFSETDLQYSILFSLESLKNPRKKQWFSEPESGKIMEFDDGVNSLICSLVKDNENSSFNNLFSKDEIVPQGKNCDLDNYKIPQSFKNYTVSINTGQISRWKSGNQIYYDNGANRMWMASLDIKFPSPKYWGVGGSIGWDRGGQIQEFELLKLIPDTSVINIGNVQTRQWFITLHLNKYYISKNFEFTISFGGAVFFINRMVGVGTDEEVSRDTVVPGGELTGVFRGLIFHHHIVNTYIEIRGGLLAGHLKSGSEFNHDIFNHFDASQLFPGGTVGGIFISGGISFSFRP
jgi:hypothetical protein